MKLSSRLAATVALVCLSLPNAYTNEGDEPVKTITYLGVSTFHLAQPLREHLEINEGFGVQVHEVIEDSPAEKAGLKKNDILLKFREQILISPEHLSLLVRNEENAAIVPLTLIRKGTEETVEVTLGKIEQTNPRIRPRPDERRMSPDQWQEHLKDQQDYWENWMTQRQPRRREIPPRREGDREQEDDRERRAVAGRPPAVSVSPGFPVRVFGTDGVIKIDNEQGEVLITHEGEGHRIVIKNAGGNEVYAGPYDADLGVEGLPEAARDQLEAMKLDNLELLAPRVPEEAPEKTSSPMPLPPEAPSEDLL